MHKTCRHLLFLIHAVMALVLYAGPTLCQTPSDDLLKQRLTLKVDDVPFITVLATLSVEHKIPVGLELGTVSYDEVRRSINVANASLEQILNLISGHWPAYRWEVVEGVVNFVPVSERDPLIEKLLCTTVSRFSHKKGIDRFALRDSIIETPEVKSFLSVNDVSVFRLGDPARISDTVGEMDLSVSATDVKGILNKVIRESERKFWVVGRRREQTKAILMSL